MAEGALRRPVVLGGETRRASYLLEGDGLLALEVGVGQAAAVLEILSMSGWKLEKIVKDFGGIERIVAVRVAR